MAIMWPIDLPQKPQRDQWSRTGQESRWTFEPDAGPGFSRPAGQKGDLFAMTFVMTKEQTVLFREFYHNTLASGSLCFTYPDPDSNEELTVRFANNTGNPYDIKARGVDRIISMTWELMP